MWMPECPPRNTDLDHFAIISSHLYCSMFVAKEEWDPGLCAEHNPNSTKKGFTFPSTKFCPRLLAFNAVALLTQNKNRHAKSQLGNTWAASTTEGNLCKCS